MNSDCWVGYLQHGCVIPPAHLDPIFLADVPQVAARLHQPREPLHLPLQHLLLALKQLLVTLILASSELRAVRVGAFWERERNRSVPEAERRESQLNSNPSRGISLKGDIIEQMGRQREID